MLSIRPPPDGGLSTWNSGSTTALLIDFPVIRLPDPLTPLDLSRQAEDRQPGRPGSRPIGSASGSTIPALWMTPISSSIAKAAASCPSTPGRDGPSHSHGLP